MGTFKLIPSTLALRAVHKHNAASKSAKPLIKAQHLLPDGGFPMTMFTKPSTSAHTPSLSVSLGHLAGAGEGVGLGLGLGEGVGVGLHEPQETDNVV